MELLILSSGELGVGYLEVNKTIPALQGAYFQIEEIEE